MPHATLPDHGYQHIVSHRKIIWALFCVEMLRHDKGILPHSWLSFTYFTFDLVSHLTFSGQTCHRLGKNIYRTTRRHMHAFRIDAMQSYTHKWIVGTRSLPQSHWEEHTFVANKMNTGTPRVPPRLGSPLRFTYIFEDLSALSSLVEEKRCMFILTLKLHLEAFISISLDMQHDISR